MKLDHLRHTLRDVLTERYISHLPAFCKPHRLWMKAAIVSKHCFFNSCLCVKTATVLLATSAMILIMNSKMFLTEMGDL